VLGLLTVPLAVALAVALAPGPDAAAAARPSFARDVAPVLARWCVRCHGARTQGGGLRLDSYPALMRGGDSGPPVIAGDAPSSLLVAKIERRDRPPMPPRRPLPAALVKRLRVGSRPARALGSRPTGNSRRRR
jgi:mono/diheme cytochrome c family protein